MIMFWVIVAALVVAALLFVIPPLLRRADKGHAAVDRDSLTVSIYQDQLAELENDLRNDTITQEQYEQGRLELERRMLEDVPGAAAPSEGAAPGKSNTQRWSAVMAGLAVPLAAVTLYLNLGNLEAIKPQPDRNTAQSGESHGQTPQQIVAMIEQLAQRLEQNPNDARGWAMLGRSYLFLEQFPQARQAFANAVQLSGDDPQLLADYADALAMAREGQSLEGEPMELIKRALELDPANQKALWLAGTAAYERGEDENALEYWETLRDNVPPGSEAAQAMEGNIAELRGLLSRRGSSASPSAPAAEEQVTAKQDSAAGDGVISGKVSLAPALQEKAQPDDTVYIFARAPEGPPMPLAIARTTVGDLPMSFTLDDSMSITPAARLSKFERAVVGARVSKSGDAMAQSGDLQGMSPEVSVGTRDVQVIIDEIVP